MKKIISSLFIFTFSVFALAQEAKTVFVNMPDSITPLLTAVNRADFIDFLESNMKAEVKNKFDETSEMTELTDSFINIKMTSESSWQMKLLPLPDNSQIICVSTTACGPVCDSSIRFYTTEWKELPLSDYIELPSENDFYTSPSGTEELYQYNSLRDKADIFLYKTELSPDSPILSFTYTTPEYLDIENREKIQSYIKPQLQMTWTNGKFISN